MEFGDPTQWLDGNRLTLLNSGAAYFPALISAIDQAQSHVWLETYLYADDPTGQAVTAALIRAARRGVAVRVLVDGFGAKDFPQTFMPQLTAEGVQALVYRPEVALFRFRKHRLRRLHRKLVVIDGAIAFVGGINIIDDLNTPHQIPPRFDFAVRVEGPLLRPIQHAMERLWKTVVWASFRRRNLAQGQWPLKAEPVNEPANEPVDWASPSSDDANQRPGQRAAFVQRTNFRHRRAIEDAYLNALAQAKNEVLIANAYFLPGQRFRRALFDAARRGVRITILLQGRVEYPLVHYAAQALYRSFLLAGIRIVEYRRSFLHAKVAVMDKHWATVGSSNIDPFSLLMSKEANLVIDDPGFAHTLHDELHTAMEQGGYPLHAGEWMQMSRFSRGLRWLCYQLIRGLMGLAGLHVLERRHH